MTSAGEKEEGKKVQGGHRRDDQLAHVAAELAPPMSPATPQVDHPLDLKRMESGAVPAPAAVSKDTQKFISFAGSFTLTFSCSFLASKQVCGCRMGYYARCVGYRIVWADNSPSSIQV